jgi:hypothetical protein
MTHPWLLALVGGAGILAGFCAALLLFFFLGGPTHTRVRDLPTGTYTTVCQNAVTFEGEAKWAALVHSQQSGIIIYVLSSRQLPARFSILNGKAIAG